MEIEQVQSILLRKKKDIAFIFGNGINRHYNKNNVSWNDLLLDLWDKYTFDTQSIKPPGISFTEFYDVLEIQNYQKENFDKVLQKEVVEIMAEWNPNNDQNLILNKVKKINAPLLTTNFDRLIPLSLELEFRKLERNSDLYPWSYYYSDKELKSPIDGFGVWFINGMVKYHRSIKLGLSQYMGNVSQARRFIHGEASLFSFEGKNTRDWPGSKSWLHILFNKSLFIVGLGLDESEIFIRWLLIERAKYYRKYPDRKHNGWFIYKEDPKEPISEGKKFFLKSVGFEIIRMGTYNNIYEDIWY